MEVILDKLTDYVLILSNALANDRDANDRPYLKNHLAASAEMYALLYQHEDVSAIEDLVKSENRSHGWSYLNGPSGDKISTAWVAFAKATGYEYQNT